MRHLVLVFTLLATFTVSAAVSVNADSLFQDRSPLSLRLVADFTSILEAKDKSSVYPARLIWADDTGQHDISVDLTLRGNFRLNHCEVPGLRIEFNDDVPGVFAGQNKLKLVTQCKRDSSMYQDYVLQEYDTYQAFELISDYSFKSRLARTTYEDTGEGQASWEEWSFVIEDWKALQYRLDLSAYKENRINRDQLDPQTTADLSLFQYLIGNTDYSLLKGEGDEPCCHNVKVLIGETGLIPVPYDFDLAGVIDATYAAPPVGLGINEVTERLYRGFCAHNAELANSIERFKSVKAGIYAAYENNEVRAKARKKTSRFLDKFYKDIENEKRIDKKILKTCR